MNIGLVLKKHKRRYTLYSQGQMAKNKKTGAKKLTQTSNRKKIFIVVINAYQCFIDYIKKFFYQ